MEWRPGRATFCALKTAAFGLLVQLNVLKVAVTYVGQTIMNVFRRSLRAFRCRFLFVYMK